MSNQPNKTQATTNSIDDFLNSIKDETKRQDSQKLIKIMQKITSQPPVLWGNSIIGFGKYHYKYASGREGDMAAAGFSPRASNLTIYFVEGVNNYPDLLQKLGPHRIGKACLYIKKLDGIDINVLKELIEKSYGYVTRHSGNMHRAN